MIFPDRALVIGNGESRAFLDLSPLKNVVTLIGCNAIHRDLRVDHLICCDHRMVQEVLKRKKSRKIQNIYTRQRYFVDFNKIQQERRVKVLPDLPYQGIQKPDQPEHWGSGPYAVLLAGVLGFKEIYILGFDLHSKTRLVNNVYKNTPNYLEESKPAVDPAYWIYQIRKVFTSYPDTAFKIFNHPEWQIPDEWKLPNVSVFDINTFGPSIASTINISYNSSTVDSDAQPT